MKSAVRKVIRNKAAFDRCLSVYDEIRHGGNTTSQELRFCCDVENGVEGVIVDHETLDKFWSIYSAGIVDPIKQELFAQVMFGDTRHKWEQKIGRDFMNLGLYPLSRYWKEPPVPPNYATIVQARHGCFLPTVFTNTANALPVEVTIKSEEEMAEYARQVYATNTASREVAAGLPESGYVYFIYDPDKKDQVKIGMASNPEDRLKSLRTACPDLRILLTIRTSDMRADEAYHHARWSAQRRGDSEWFYLNTELLAFIEKNGGVDAPQI
jgi:T5orf172 domain